MANQLIIKHRTGTTGNPDGSTVGEISANIFDKKFFIATGSGNLVFATQDYLDGLMGNTTGTGLPTMTDGTIDATYLPASAVVSDVLSFTSTGAFPGAGALGVIYVAEDTNKIYRWTGAVYSELGPDGVTNLTYSASPTEVTVESSTGNSTSIASASPSIAGVMTVALYNKLNNIVFGTADTNAVVVDSATIASGEFAKFTANGLESRSTAEVKTDLGLNLVQNTALSTWTGTTALATIGTITTGVWQGSAIADAYIASAGTWNAKQDPQTTLAGYGITDAYTKAQTDSLLQGLSTKEEVVVASTANIDLTTGGLLTIDGETLLNGDRVLVKDQTIGLQNGIYTAAVGAWTRATDADTSTKIRAAYAFVEKGTVNSDTAWVCSTDDIILNTTAIVFIKFSGAGSFQAEDADLSAIAALTGATGFLTKSGEGAWVIDTTAYQVYDVNTAKYNDATSNFTGTLQNSGVAVLNANSVIDGGTW